MTCLARDGRARCAAGFTLIEIIVVLTLAGLFARVSEGQFVETKYSLSCSRFTGVQSSTETIGSRSTYTHSLSGFNLTALPRCVV